MTSSAQDTAQATVQASGWPLSAFRLDGRVVLVTGARRAIGRAIALALASQGGRVAVHHVGNDEERADADGVVAEITAFGGAAQPFAADFSRPGSAPALAAAVESALGPIDVVVLNASIELVEPWDGIRAEAFERQMRINLQSPLELLQAVVPGMAARGWGRVLGIGSIQQQRPHPGMLIYAGTKAAQANWVRNLARQVGRAGVTVNTLAPGAIETPRNRNQLADAAQRGPLEQRIPVGRVGTPDDLVGAAMLLCSDAGRYINGIDLFVDGGLHAA